MGWIEVPTGEEMMEKLKNPKRTLEQYFRIHERGSTWGGEIRAGLVLFMTSAYILFLNPLILSGAGSGTITGMPRDDVVLATAISTGVATFFMGVVPNYPWVVSVQLGTNSYFVNSVLQPFQPCGKHSHFEQNGAKCSGQPCSCNADGSVIEKVGVLEPNGSLNTAGGVPCAGTSAACLGTAIGFEQALAATFLEGLVFLLICFTGMRSRILRLFPKTILMSGACGIGIFIAFVGLRGMPVIVPAPYPNLTRLASDLNIGIDGYGNSSASSGIYWNDCKYVAALPPHDIFCPWLGIGGLIFTGILMLWNVNGAFIFGIFFTMFVSWGIFPHKQGNGGPIPNKAIDFPSFTTTAGALSFDWGDNTGKLVEAFFTFLYLDFIGSSITFVSMGSMCGILDDDGNIPYSNRAFISDGLGSTMGGLLGTSALTTYVESASAVREGGRTGLTAVICSILFFLSVFLYPIFSSIPSIATAPILTLIGVLIFMTSVTDIPWDDITEAGPAFITIIIMPTTNNIAYGCIAGFIAYFIAKFFTFQLHPIQKKWPGYGLYCRMTVERSMHIKMERELEEEARRVALARGEGHTFSSWTRELMGFGSTVTGREADASKAGSDAKPLPDPKGLQEVQLSQHDDSAHAPSQPPASKA